MNTTAPGRRDSASDEAKVENNSTSGDKGEFGFPMGHISFLRSNRGIGLCLLIATLLIGASIWTSDWAHETVRDGFQLGAFPLFAIGMMAASVLIMLLDSKARGSTPGIMNLSLLDVVLVVLILSTLGGLFLLIPVLGFAVVMFLIVLLGAMVLGFRPIWIAVSTAAGAAAGLQALTFLLGVNFPLGILSFLGG